MGKFFGELAGFLMISLIITLFIKLLWDIKIIKNKETLQQFKKLSILVACIGFLYLLFGGFIYNYSVQQVSVGQFDVIWKFGNIDTILSHLETGINEGLFNILYIKIVNIVGTIFFKQYISGAVYTSFIFTILAFWLFFLAGKYFIGENATNCFISFGLVIPYSYRLFLPTSASLIFLIIAIFTYGILHITKLKIPDKIREYSWQGFGVDIVFVLLILANGLVLYQNVTQR